MTELARVVDAAVETARPVIEAKRHRFAVDIAPEPVMFGADPLRLAQVLSNLLTNAAKYTDPGGVIQLRATADTEQIALTVSDTGIGIGTGGDIECFFDVFPGEGQSGSFRGWTG